MLDREQQLSGLRPIATRTVTLITAVAGIVIIITAIIATMINTTAVILTITINAVISCCLPLVTAIASTILTAGFPGLAADRVSNFSYIWGFPKFRYILGVPILRSVACLI